MGFEYNIIINDKTNAVTELETVIDLFCEEFEKRKIEVEMSNNKINWRFSYKPHKKED